MNGYTEYMKWLDKEIAKGKPVKVTATVTKTRKQKLPDYGVEVKNMPKLFGIPTCKKA